MADVPYDEYGKDALGTMWHECTEDAQVIGFAIRESSRCCSMSHSGIGVPWTRSGDSSSCHMDVREGDHAGDDKLVTCLSPARASTVTRSARS